MRTPLLLAAGLAALSVAGAGPGFAQSRGGTAAKAVPGKPSGGLTAFRSDSELRAYLRRLRRQQEKSRAYEPVPVPMPAPMAAPPPPPPPAAGAPAPSPVVVTGTAVASPSAAKAADGITNNQEANVDEGGIVKMRGDTLVILRRRARR